MKTKNILLFTVTIIYFFVSYDVIDLPYKIIDDKGYMLSNFWNPDYGTMDHDWEKESKNSFHSKLFVNIKIIYGNVYASWADGTIEKEARPVEKMWILSLINWYKAILISLLYSSLFLTKLKRENEQYYFFYFVPGVIWSFFTLFNLSPSYGLSEIIIIILLAINFMPKSNYYNYKIGSDFP